MLDKIILNELEDIVGAENVSDSAPITVGYAYNWCTELSNYIDKDSPSQFSEVPKAVILPASTKEVQKIVRVCNDYNIKFKAQSTGFGPWNQPKTDNCIIVDLKRMNKIVKIDEKNLYAVIEPYVSGAQLQAELMKVGLNCHMPGAGSQVSPLASHTSMAGPGFTSPKTGHSARNVLGVEWVLPPGEILRLGSLGLKNQADWFSGDGPGPSLRGIMRGWVGTKSGLGIFTRVAVKVFPYPCETEFEIQGNLPNYEFKIPDFLKLYLFDCKTNKSLAQTIRKISEEEIAFICTHLSSFGMMAIFSNSIEELLQQVPIGAMKKPLLVLIAARTEREFEYKKKVMEYLMEKLELTNEVGKTFKPHSLFYAEALRSNLGHHGFLATGSFLSSGGSADTIDLCLNALKDTKFLKELYIEKEAIANDFGEGAWATTYEDGHYSHIEFPTMYDQTDQYSIEGMSDFLENSDKLFLLNNLGAPFFVESSEMHEFFGPYMLDYHKLLRKVKNTFDPNNVSEAGFYISPKSFTKKDFIDEFRRKLRKWDYENQKLEKERKFDPIDPVPVRKRTLLGRSYSKLIRLLDLMTKDQNKKKK
ncbi:MAG: FAD-binding oxidoreductase [Promethearchaeia archaeon]